MADGEVPGVNGRVTQQQLYEALTAVRLEVTASAQRTTDDLRESFKEALRDFKEEHDKEHVRLSAAFEAEVQERAKLTQQMYMFMGALGLLGATLFVVGPVIGAALRTAFHLL